MNDTIFCVSEEKIYDVEDVRRVVIIADSKPATMPTTGEGVDRLRDSAKIGAGSIMLCLADSSKYIMNSVGTWVQWNA